jgi:CobQ-like glutamine amidotransferase family enzyme
VQKIRIAHLYPNEMNIYGDLGNIIALTKRLEWRGYSAEVLSVEVGRPFDFTNVDLVFGGGGQDSGQLLIGTDLLMRAEDITAMAHDGVPMLVICGTYQLFGESFTTLEGNQIAGIRIFEAKTVASQKRMIGNVVIDSPFGRLVGFENHSGETELADDQKPLGRVKKGFGNNSRSGFEGAISENVIGSYMHGPLLPKNPRLTDHLILTALKRRFGVNELVALDDRAETQAANNAIRRP